MSTTYLWNRGHKTEWTREVFDALMEVDDLSILQDVEAVIEYGELRGIFSDFRRTRGGRIRAGDSGWMISNCGGEPGYSLTSLRFTVPDPKPAPPVGVELAKKAMAVVFAAPESLGLPDDWHKHVAIIPRLTREDLLALEEEPEGYRVVWIDMQRDMWKWTDQSSTEELVSSYGLRDAFVLPLTEED